VIRIVLFLAFIAVLAFGAAWIADRPGEIVMTWQGWRISTSVVVAGVALAILIVLAIVLWSLARFTVRLPDLVTLFLREHRRSRGWRAISRGLIAIGVGDLKLATRSATEARTLVAGEPLTLLLTAQAAQLAGDTAGAEAEFRAMLSCPETRALGLRGLYIEARRRADAVAARVFVEEAARTDPALPWATDALIEFQCLAGDWREALAMLERQARAGAIDKPTRRRRRAVLLTAQALATEEMNPGKARELAREAAKLAPDLVPAAALAGRLLGAAGSLRRAARIVEKAWTANPHPDLAQVYVDLRPGDGGRDRLKRAKTLAKKAPNHPESVLAVARAALEASEFDEARIALAPLVADPTQRACLLLAEIEASEHSDHGKAREWTARAARARRDPAWVADNYVSERWLPASPVTGKLDAFVWTVPPVLPAGPLLEQARGQAVSIPPLPTFLRPRVMEEGEDTGERRSRRGAGRTTKGREGVAPVVAEPPRPDDPGPEPGDETARKRFRLFEWLTGPAP
jgi:HemY protein